MKDSKWQRRMTIRPSSRLAKALDPRIVSLAAALPAVGADVNLHHQVAAAERLGTNPIVAS
jgi:hypothetical protein